jgi:hypothetical protein
LVTVVAIVDTHDAGRIVNDTQALLRFCIARKFVVADTVEMVRAHIEWRREMLPVQGSDFAVSQFPVTKPKLALLASNSMQMLTARAHTKQ